MLFASKTVSCLSQTPHFQKNWSLNQIYADRRHPIFLGIGIVSKSDIYRSQTPHLSMDLSFIRAYKACKLSFADTSFRIIMML